MDWKKRYKEIKNSGIILTTDIDIYHLKKGEQYFLDSPKDGEDKGWHIKKTHDGPRIKYNNNMDAYIFESEFVRM